MKNEDWLKGCSIYTVGYNTGFEKAVEQTKKACAEAITTSAQIDGYIGLRPSDIVDIIMKVKVE